MGLTDAPVEPPVCGVLDCPNRARGHLTPRDDARHREDYDPLCADHAVLSSLRAQAAMMSPGCVTYNTRAKAADRMWRRLALLDLPIPNRAIPSFARGASPFSPRSTASDER